MDRNLHTTYRNVRFLPFFSVSKHFMSFPLKLCSHTRLLRPSVFAVVTWGCNIRSVGAVWRTLQSSCVGRCRPDRLWVDRRFKEFCTSRRCYCNLMAHQSSPLNDSFLYNSSCSFSLSQRFEIRSLLSNSRDYSTQRIIQSEMYFIMHSAKQG